MKVLIDENLPARLKNLLDNTFEIYSIHDKGWTSLENGDLLNSMSEEKFDCLITSDKNIPHQNSIEKYGIRIIILRIHNNRIESIIPITNKINQVIYNSTELVTYIFPDQ
ncbi:MAG: DUF5615 family PIN-like protein [Fimbriimonadaceae bacterium]|nr:DUF5615 family PIN-like protein [Chitinophagales bacterium]